MGIFNLFRPDKDKIYDKGVDALKRGDISAAIQHFSRVVNIDPTDAPAHYNLAVSYVSAKNYTAGVHHFKEYTQLDPDGADEDLREYINVLEKVASAEKTQAEQILRAYVTKQEQASSEVSVASKKIRFESLLKTADDLLFTKGFFENKTVQKFAKAMSAKIPLRFYGVKGLQNMNPRDAFGFATAFTSTGYAVAKASIKLLGHSVYLAALPEDVVRRFRVVQHEEEIPISYDMPLMKNGNPIPRKLVHRVLEACIESNLSNFFSRFPWTRSSAEAIKEHLVKEFVFVGYYIGLYENIVEREI